MNTFLNGWWLLAALTPDPPEVSLATNGAATSEGQTDAAIVAAFAALHALLLAIILTALAVAWSRW